MNMTSDNSLRLIGITAIGSILLTTTVLELWRNYRKQVTAPERPRVPKYNEELIREQLARNYAFLGEEGMDKIRKLYIVVVGAGGVGSWTTTMLIRSGVGKVRVIDFDQVSLSSLNRLATATIKDVGTSKVNCLKLFLDNVAPFATVDPVNELWNRDNADRLILANGRPDFVIDCIDNLDTKVDLLTYCHEQGIEVVSSGGAACKSDPTRVNIGDIRVTEEDPLMKSVRRRLKQRGIMTGINMVFSAEKPDPRKANLLPLPEGELEKGRVGELTPFENFRIRILPVLGPIPGMFGLTIVAHILNLVGGYPVEPIEGKNRMKIFDAVFMSLAAQQARLGYDQVVPVSVNDVEYLLSEVFRGKSPISGYSTRLVVSRWKKNGPIAIQNLVIMTKSEQKLHEELVLVGDKQVEEVYSKEVIELVEKRFEEERYYSKFR